MHEHLFYVEPGSAVLHGLVGGEMFQTGPRLYLAAGVTTARTTGSIEPDADLNVKRLVDAGLTPGPDFDITGSTLTGQTLTSLCLGADDATRTVNYWAEEGAQRRSKPTCSSRRRN